MDQDQYHDQEYRESPIPFIEIELDQDKNTQFVINPEAEKILKTMTSKKVAVLVIAGPQRTGKSFLANRLLKRMNGFAIGPTINPCTKGIWIWSKPISLTNEIDVIILDTEGLNSTERDTTIDAKVFAISLLLSSYFIFNCFGHIDENTLENISLIIQLSKNINISSKSQTTTTDEADFARYFPQFLWVLRDFSLDLKGRSPNEYFEYALQNVKGNTSEIRRKNDIREKIKLFFKNRELYCLIRPLSDETKLARIETQSWEDLKPEFTKGVKELINKIYNNIRPKIIQGKALTGEMLLNLTKQYLESINKGGIPTILTSLERVISNEMKRIFDDLVKEYKEKIEIQLNDKDLPIDEEELISRHKSIVSNILKKLEINTDMIGPKEISFIENKLQTGFESTLKTKLLVNNEKSSAIAKKVISQFANVLKVPNPGDIDNFTDIRASYFTPFRNKYNDFFEQYTKNMKGGNMKFKPYAEMMPNLIMSYFENILNVCETIHDQELDTIKGTLAVARQGEESLRRMLKDQEEMLEQMKQTRLESTRIYESLEGDYDKLNRKYKNIQDEYGKNEAELKSALNAEREKYNKLIQEFNNKSSGEKKNIFKIQEELIEKNNELTHLRNRVKILESTVNELKEENEDLLNKLQDQKTQVNQENVDVEHLNKENEVLHEQIESLQKHIEELIEKSKRSELNESELTGDLDRGTMLSTNSSAFHKEPMEDLQLEDDSDITEESLISKCINDDLKKDLRIIFRNYKKQAKIFDQKTFALAKENSKLKAKIIDLKKEMDSASLKDKDIKNLKDDTQYMLKSLELKTNQIESLLKQLEDRNKQYQDLTMKLAEIKAQVVHSENERESLLFFIKETIKRCFNRENMYKYALSSISERDQEYIKSLLKELSIML